MIAAGPRFRFHETDVVAADVDVELTRTRRAGIHSMTAHVTDDVFDRIIPIPGRFVSLNSPVESPS